jgi:DNA-binding response OmpR family regulator
MVTVMTCRNCADLAEQLAAAKRALGEDAGTDDLSAMRHWLNLSKSRARIVLRLYRAKTRFLPAWLLTEELANPDVDPRTINVHVHQIRKIIGHDAIENCDGVGYRLSPCAYNRVRDALAAGA